MTGVHSGQRWDPRRHWAKEPGCCPRASGLFSDTPSDNSLRRLDTAHSEQCREAGSAHDTADPSASGP